MTLQEAIKFCQLHMRRNTWLTEEDWRGLIQSSVTDLQKATDMMQGYVRIQMVEDKSEYSLQPVYRILGDVRFDSTAITLEALEVMLDRGYTLTTSGTPTHVYPVGMEDGGEKLGVYPVPDSDAAGKYITFVGHYWPTPITVDTPLTQDLPFELIDHNTVCYGAIIAAERIDTDFQASELVRRDYESGILSMRHRARTRAPGTSRMIAHGR